MNLRVVWCMVLYLQAGLPDMCKQSLVNKNPVSQSVCTVLFLRGGILQQHWHKLAAC